MRKDTCTQLYLYALDITRMLDLMGSETAMTRADASELNDIMWNWEKAYDIRYDDTTYIASRLGYPEHLLTAETPSDLRSLIRSDYAAWLASLKQSSSL